MFCWLNETGAIRCPYCNCVSNYRSIEWNSEHTFVSGNASCRCCVTTSPPPRVFPSVNEQVVRDSQSSRIIPLTFVFLYDTITGQVVTYSKDYETNYYVKPYFGQDTKQTKSENPIMNVYVIRRRDARNLIVDVITTERQAERAYRDCLNLEILSHKCDHPSIGGVARLSFEVWVVTIGKGDSTRIVGVFADKKEAAKVAAPIQGRLRELEAVPNKRQVKSISVYKSFVSMTDDISEYHRAQVIDRVSVRRKLYEGEEEILFPMATFRRRYNSSLPHRIEILAISERTAKIIAMQFGNMKDEEICEMLEYNVDYQLFLEDNEWRFDPCLLNQPV